eukprot:jgi/Pico_ML_1/54464/g4808.t1
MDATAASTAPSTPFSFQNEAVPNLPSNLRQKVLGTSKSTFDPTEKCSALPSPGSATITTVSSSTFQYSATAFPGVYG